MRFGSAKVDPFISVEVEPKPEGAAKPQTDAQRRSDPRARALQLFKKSDSDEYGFHHDPSYYRDFAGPESSEYAWDFLITEAMLLELPRLVRNNAWINLGSHFDRKTGLWINGLAGCAVSVPIVDLRTAVNERIAELGISEVLLLEWLAVPHSIAEEMRDRTLSFEEKMARFKQATI